MHPGEHHSGSSELPGSGLRVSMVESPSPRFLFFTGFGSVEPMEKQVEGEQGSELEKRRDEKGGERKEGRGKKFV